MKPNIIFFSRSYQNKLFPLLKSDKYNSVHVTLTKEEKYFLESIGLEVKYCFEKFNETNYNGNIDNYLISSFTSDRFLNSYNLDYRRNFLKKEICFWSNIFDEYKPIAVVNEQVAIEIAEVMYIEAKNRNIRYLAWMTNPINGFFYWLDDPMSLSFVRKFDLKKPNKKTLQIADEYIQNIKIKNERPYYLDPYLGQKKIKRVLGSISSYLRCLYRETSFFGEKKTFYETYKQSALISLYASINSIFRKYDDLSNLKNYEIVLYPLHYEPEASLSYLSEFFSNQIALIENIAKCLKTNQIIVVKEHPAQPGILQTKKYRLLKKNVSNLYYLSHEVTSFQIIKRSKLIITLTSHLGWEALILGKPVFLLGKMFYDSHPQINRFESFEKLRERIRNEDYLYPEEHETIKFISKLLERSYRGKPFRDKDLFSDENINNIITAIEKKLEELIPSEQNY